MGVTPVMDSRPVVFLSTCVGPTLNQSETHASSPQPEFQGLSFQCQACVQLVIVKQEPTLRFVCTHPSYKSFAEKVMNGSKASIFKDRQGMVSYSFHPFHRAFPHHDICLSPNRWGQSMSPPLQQHLKLDGEKGGTTCRWFRPSEIDHVHVLSEDRALAGSASR